jgi:predicted O-methyltransferase YrrM
MLDSTHLNPPAVLLDIATETQAIGFTLSSDLLTGTLLRMLAASKPGGNLLELGTGTGMGTAWILDGMDAAATLSTVDRNEDVATLARKHLNDTRVTFHSTDTRVFIATQQESSFDFVFADTPYGKFHMLDETLKLLKPGGLYIVDDLLPQPKWEPSQNERVNRLVEMLEQRVDLRITKLNWSTGIIIAAKI